METVKEYLGYINPHWIAVVVTGMYTHLRQICIIGLCFDEDNNGPPFDPSYASVLFTFSVLCLLAEYRLWPRTLKEPPIQLLYIYEVNCPFNDSNFRQTILYSFRNIGWLTDVGSGIDHEFSHASNLGTIYARYLLFNSRVQ